MRLVIENGLEVLVSVDLDKSLRIGGHSCNLAFKTLRALDFSERSIFTQVPNHSGIIIYVMRTLNFLAILFHVTSLM